MTDFKKVTHIKTGNTYFVIKRDVIECTNIDVKEAVESDKKKPFNNCHSKEEQELNLYNALTDYCDM